MPTKKSKKTDRAAFARIVLAKLVWILGILVAKEWPEMPRWWTALYTRFLTSRCRQLVLRAGRRSGKSSWACCLAVAFALVYAGLGLVPPGDIGWCVFVSVSKDEADERLATIEKILRAIGVKFVPHGEGILIHGTNIGFRVQACTVAAVSGWTSILIVADECAKWRNGDGANPAREVLAGLRPTMASQPLAVIILQGSPLGNDDAHAEAFDAGESAFQQVAHAETWVANPSISEAATHELEPDPRIWSREYAAIAQAGALSAFDVEAIDRAIAHEGKFEGVGGVPSLILDPSSGRKDSFTWCLAQWIEMPADPGFRRPALLRFSDFGSMDGRFWQHASGDAIVDRLAALAKRHHVREVHGDQREALMLESAFRRHGLRYRVHDWTASTKPDAVERVRGWLRDNVIVLPPHDRLRREMLAFEERISASGMFTFGARGNGRDDFVALLVTAAMADIRKSLSRPGRNAPATPEERAAANRRSMEWLRAQQRPEFDPGPRGMGDNPDPAKHQAQFDAYVRSLGGGR